MKSEFPSKEEFVSRAIEEEIVVEVSPYLVLRVQVDKSVYCWRYNGIERCTFSLSQLDIEALAKAIRS
jgi:hypothetical protein